MDSSTKWELRNNPLRKIVQHTFAPEVGSTFHVQGDEGQQKK